MESPRARGRAEDVVSGVLDWFFENQEKLVTDPSKVVFGPSLPVLITQALRDSGLLKDTV